MSTLVMDAVCCLDVLFATVVLVAVEVQKLYLVGGRLRHSEMIMVKAREGGQLQGPSLQ